MRIDNTDTPTPGDSIDAITPWRHASNWNSLTWFVWESRIVDMSTYVDPGATAVQVRFRVSDWQWIKGATAPVTLNPGPGPYIDRVRIGRVTFSGPTFGVPGYDGLAPSYYASQDGFPSARPNSFLEDFVPTTDRFGTVDFAASSVDVFSPYPPGSPYTYNSRDSIVVRVDDPLGAGVTSVGVHAAIVAGPHAGNFVPTPAAHSRAPRRIRGDGTRRRILSYMRNVDDASGLLDCIRPKWSASAKPGPGYHE